MTPRNDRILVELMPWEQSRMLVVDPDGVSRMQRGRIVAKGPKVTDVSEGDVVLFSRAAWHELPNNQALIREQALAAVIGD